MGDAVTDLEKAERARSAFLRGDNAAFDRGGDFEGISVSLRYDEARREQLTLVSWLPPKPTLANKLRSAWQAAVEDWRSW